MPLVLFVNTFLTNGNLYLEGSPVWEAASVPRREQSLSDATRVLDQNVWAGSAVSAAQPLSWPRAAFSYYDPNLNLTVSVPASTVPLRLERATAFLAQHYLTFPEALELYSTSYEKIKIGPIELENTDAASSTSKVPLYSSEVLALVRPLLNDSNRSTTMWWRAN